VTNTRKYVRHPSDIPINVSSIGTEHPGQMQDLSLGGICCEVKHNIEIGTKIVINIPIVKPAYRGFGVVVWCRPEGDHYDIGIQFQEEAEAFKSRMIEQVCQIEHYKLQVQETEGRKLDGESAALEWIHKHAAEFAAQIGE
jgi:hypothetical protein